MPPVTNHYDTSQAKAAYDLAVKWHTADVMGIGAPPPEGVSADDIKGWGSEQVCGTGLLTIPKQIQAVNTTGLTQIVPVDGVEIMGRVGTQARYAHLSGTWVRCTFCCKIVEHTSSDQAVSGSVCFCC